MQADTTSGFLFARIRGGHADWQHATALAWAGDELQVVHEAKGPKLTPRQRLVFAFVEAYTARQGYPPTIREVMAAVGLKSPSAAAYQLGRLRLLGYLTSAPTKQRATTAGGAA